VRPIEAALGRARGWCFDPEAYHPAELDELVDDRLVEAFSMVGSGAALVEQFRVVAMGFSSISLKLAPVRGGGRSSLDGLRETITTVVEAMPEIRRRVPGPPVTSSAYSTSTLIRSRVVRMPSRFVRPRTRPKRIP
jgi:hypothetical protein